MISKEFKDLVKGVKKLGRGYDVPYNILFDKVTGELKQTPKNIQAFELVKLYDKIDDTEKKALQMGWRGDSKIKHALDAYLKAEFGQDTSIFTFSLPDLSSDYRRKMKTILAKKERDTKKAEVEREKQKLILSLNRKDIAQSISKIQKSMEPYIKGHEKSIESTFKSKEKELLSDWTSIQKSMEDNGVVIIRPSKNPVSTIQYSPIQYNGPSKTVKDYILDNHYSFANKWFNTKLYSLNTTATYIFDGKVGDLISQFQKAFRQGEEFKVEVLFHRLIKINPTLRDYTLTSPYNGSEFTLSATNDKGVNYTINTNTITAGGYNIQRLHTRWLVTVRNSQTGKIEKFTIDDKTTK
jgi:hypothetical protein